MRRSIAVILVICSLAGLTVPLAGCDGWASAQSGETDAQPFYDDRVATIRIVMSAEDWDSCQQNAEAEEYVAADFWFDDELVPDVGVRPKGNSSLNAVVKSGSIRMSLKVDFNFFNAARTFYGLKKINLNNGFSDPTLIREALAYEIFEQMGVPTPRASFVDVWVNDTHLGLYTMVEQIDKTFLERHFDDSSGNLYKPERAAALLDWTEADLKVTGSSVDDVSQDINLGGGKLSEIMQALEQEETTAEEAGGMAGQPLPQGDGPVGEAPAENLPRGDAPPGAALPVADTPAEQGQSYLDLMELKTNENNPDHTALFRLLEVLNDEPDETFAGEIEAVLDVDEVLRFLAVSAAIVHLDNYIGMGHNYYLYEVDGKFTVIPWDLNMAFGTFKAGLNAERLVNFYIDEPTSGPVANYPLVDRLLSVPEYMETYHGYLEELIDGPFSETVMSARIDEMANLIRPCVIEDDLKFFTTEQFEAGLSGGSTGNSQHSNNAMVAYGLKGFIAERVKSIGEQLAGTRAAGSGDGSGNRGINNNLNRRRG